MFDTFDMKTILIDPRGYFGKTKFYGDVDYDWAKLYYSLCGEYEISINKLATICGLPPSSIKNILYGKSQNPKLLTIKMICDGLGITLGEFFATPEFDGLEQEIK